jgi:hypothetical protein
VAQLFHAALINCDNRSAIECAKVRFALSVPPMALCPGPTTAFLARMVGPFDPRMTRDQWVLIFVCVLAATLFAAIVLCHPS